MNESQSRCPLEEREKNEKSIENQETFYKYTYMYFEASWVFINTGNLYKIIQLFILNSS